MAIKSVLSGLEKSCEGILHVNLELWTLQVFSMSLALLLYNTVIFPFISMSNCLATLCVAGIIIGVILRLCKFTTRHIIRCWYSYYQYVGVTLWYRKNDTLNSCRIQCGTHTLWTYITSAFENNWKIENLCNK